MKLANAAISATQRTVFLCSSRPIASRTAPATIGSQMARLSNPIFLFSEPVLEAAEGAQIGPQLPSHQSDDTEDHDEGVPIQVAGLDESNDRSNAAHDAGRTVDGAINQPDVAALPQTTTHPARQGGEDV